MPRPRIRSGNTCRNRVARQCSRLSLLGRVECAGVRCGRGSTAASRRPRASRGARHRRILRAAWPDPARVLVLRRCSRTARVGERMLASRRRCSPATVSPGPRPLPSRTNSRRIWSDLGTRWRISEQYFKPHPVCRWAQPAIEAALALKHAHRFRASDIIRVEIESFREAIDLGSQCRYPATTDEAQYSIAYAAAAALVFDRVGAEEVDVAALRDARVTRLLDVIALTELAEFSHRFPAERWARLRVTLTDGRTLTSEPARARGSGKPVGRRRARRQVPRARHTRTRNGGRAPRGDARRFPRRRCGGTAGAARRVAVPDRSSELTMPSLPNAADYVIIGAGVHGLSTSMHLAERLRARGRSVGANGTRIVVLDKTGIGAGASGIACGVVRNNYFQPAMRELMAHCVSRVGARPRGLQLSPGRLHADQPRSDAREVASIYDQQRAIGYESVFVEGEARVDGLHETLFDDWQATNITSVLHEKRGGYANNMASMHGPCRARRERSASRSSTASRCTGFEFGNGSAAMTAVETVAGPHRLRPGGGRRRPVGQPIWNMLELPKRSPSRAATASVHDGVRMWHYWRLQEGTLGVDPELPARPTTADAAGDPCRHRRAALFRSSTARSSPTSCGGSTTSRTSISAACRAAPRPTRSSSDAGRGRGRSLRARNRPTSSSATTSPTCGARCWRICQKRFEGKHGSTGRGAVRRHRLLHARQLPGVRPCSATMSM